MMSGLYATPIKNRCPPASMALRAGGGQAPGALHHIIARGIERKRIFTDGVDRDNFLNRLGKL